MSEAIKWLYFCVCCVDFFTNYYSIS